MDVDPGFKSFENFRGGVQCYMMKSKDIISSMFQIRQIKKEI